MNEKMPRQQVSNPPLGEAFSQEIITSGQGISASLGAGDQYNHFYGVTEISAAPVSIAPPLGQRDPRFPLRGRDELVDSLLKAVLNKDPNPRVHILNGLGGSGKTSVALEVAAVALNHDVETWWVPAATRDRFIEGMYALCRRMGISSDDIKHGDGPDFLWERLNELRRPWLLIIDNVDDPEIMEVAGQNLISGTGWLRPILSPFGTAVVTSRDSSRAGWGSWCIFHEVRVLSSGEAAKVLTDYVGNKAGSHQQATELAQQLGGLPLALRLAGAYLADATNIPPEFTDEDAVLTFAQYQAAVEQGRFDEVFPSSNDEGSFAHEEARRLVTQTWEMSLDLLHRRGIKKARQVLRLLSSFADAPIPYRALLHAQRLSESTIFSNVSGREIWEALQALNALGLIDSDESWTSETKNAVGTLRVHPLVRGISRHQNSKSNYPFEYFELAVTLAHRTAAGLERQSRDPQSWQLWSALFPHVSFLLRSSESLAFDAAYENSDILQLAADSADASLQYLQSRGYYEQAELECQAIVRVQTRILTEEHVNTLHARHRLGHVYDYRGKFEEAETEHREVLDLQRRALGEEHPDTLTTWHCLAGLLARRGQLETAEVEYRAVLNKRRQILGEEHLSTLSTRHRLGHVLADRGKLEEAETEHREVLSLQRRALGEGHPNTLETWHCLAGLLVRRGRLETAEVEYHAVLNKRRQILGEEHPGTLTTWRQLAGLLSERGQLEAAESEYRAVLGIEGRVLGEEHPSTLGTRYRLAGLLSERGQLEAAESEYRAVVEIEGRVLGEEHPSTLDSRHRLGHVLEKRGKFEEAEKEHREVLGLQQRALGEEHPTTLNTWQCLAGLLSMRGQLEAAEAEYRAVLGVEIRVLGEEHPDTLNTRHGLGHVLDSRGKLEEAEKEHREVLGLQRRALGEEHPTTLNTWHCLAGLLAKREQSRAAKDEYSAVLEVESRVLGEEHPSTLGTRYRLAGLLSERGELGAAEAEYRAVFEAESRVLGEEHPNTLTTRYRLAGLLSERGELGAAEAEYRAVFEAESRVLGEEHPNTLATRYRLAGLLFKGGKLEAAEAEYRAVLGARRRILGDEHPSTLRVQRSLESLQTSMVRQVRNAQREE
ncbi:tetratricopeptide repeat protein [Actinomadura sp. NPDC000929]|uniref:tetratricopeptide repeat protein n=1 Tax=Actinomadura sp. NPDC000929 TaxID=3154517 RepID=UPI003399EB8F